jgi:hypothetical protein
MVKSRRWRRSDHRRPASIRPPLSNSLGFPGFKSRNPPADGENLVVCAADISGYSSAGACEGEGGVATAQTNPSQLAHARRRRERQRNFAVDCVRQSYGGATSVIAGVHDAEHASRYQVHEH